MTLGITNKHYSHCPSNFKIKVSIYNLFTWVSLRHLKFSKFKIELIYSSANLPVFSLKDGGGFLPVVKSEALESPLNFYYIHTHVQPVTKSG